MSGHEHGHAPEHFDAIVVGSGPGGATVARELARAGRSVLIAERGGNAPVTGSPLRALRELGTPGRGLLLAGRGMPVVRGITTGGSSIYYYGTAFDPSLEMLRAHGVELEDALGQVKQELAVTALPPEKIGPLATRIMDSARELGHPWDPLPKFIRPDEIDGRRLMPFYSAPSYAAKWNARMFVDDAIEHGATLVTGAHVRCVLTQDDQATGIEYTHRGHSHTALAPLVVVAAGGIGSPMILRASGIAGAGRDFFYDPLVCVMGSVDDLSGAQELPMQAGMLNQQAGWVMTDMMVPRSLYMAMATQVGRLDRLGAHAHTLQIMVKIRDDLTGRLTRRGLIRKPLTKADRARLDDGASVAGAVLRQAGAHHIFRSWAFAAHPGGTVKIGDLLDANLQTGVRNLYVCDASVIPEPWGRPPTLTIVALGKRLGAHLTGAPEQSVASVEHAPEAAHPATAATSPASTRD
jgi:choline dehydrogenase-like flavoprotein